jgi:hypothetical protein
MIASESRISVVCCSERLNGSNSPPGQHRMTARAFTRKPASAGAWRYPLTG